VIFEKTDNARLLNAMHDLALRESPENRERLYSELLSAILILPTPELSGQPGHWIADGKRSIQLTGIRNNNGIEVTPAFTDQEALRNWDPNTPSLSLNARSFFELIIPLPFKEVVINPFDPVRKMIRPGGHVTRPEFEALAKGILPRFGPSTTL
jgi:hypothetical protein